MVNSVLAKVINKTFFFDVTGCFLGHNCLVPGPCKPCQNGQKLQCLNTHISFAVCNNGAYVIRQCIGRSHINGHSLMCMGDVFRKPFLYRWWRSNNEIFLHSNRLPLERSPDVKNTLIIDCLCNSHTSYVDFVGLIKKLLSIYRDSKSY